MLTRRAPQKVVENFPKSAPGAEQFARIFFARPLAPRPHRE